MSNKLRRVIAPILSVALVAGLTAPAVATSAEPVDVLSVFTDIPTDHWGRKSGSLAYCVEHEYMRGTSFDTFNPGGTVTVNQLATVLVRMSVPEDTQASLAEQARTEWIAGQQAAQADQGEEPQDKESLGARYDNKDGVHWAYEPMYTARQAGLLEGTTATEDGEEPCTRSTMARMLVNALKLRGEDTSKVNVDQAIKAMSDRYTIQSSGSADAIGVAIGVGLITGDNNKAFNPSATMDRASMCEIFYRLDNPSGQRAAALKQVGLDGSSSNGGSSNHGGSNNGQVSTATHTFDMRTPATEFHDPKEGDTVIRPDGSSVVLARDPVTGVLGYGQNVGVYLNAMTANGNTITKGWFAAAGNMGWSDVLAGGTYVKSNLPGQESTYFWSSEWEAIRTASSPNRAGIKGTDGQVTADGLWKFSAKAGGGNGGWLWQGPSFT